MATIKETYDILSTFDIPRINAALGTQFENLGQVHRAQTEAFACLSDDEKEVDLQEIEQDLARHDTTRTDIN